MKLIFDTLHERILNLEIALQANHLISERPSIVRNDDPFPQQQRPAKFIEEDLFSDVIVVNGPRLSALPILPSSMLTISEMKLRAHEFAAIFEDAFDQLNILHRALTITIQDRYHSDTSRSNSATTPTAESEIDEINCNPYALNLAGISK